MRAMHSLGCALVVGVLWSSGCGPADDTLPNRDHGHVFLKLRQQATASDAAPEPAAVKINREPIPSSGIQTKTGF